MNLSPELIGPDAAPGSEMRLRREIDLIDQVAGYYRGQFGRVIDKLNHKAPDASDLQCLRLCVEAVDMILASQRQLAQAVLQLNQRSTTLRAA